MTDLLISHILKYAKISARDKMLIRNNIRVENLNQGEKFLDLGDVANNVGFIVDGVLRNYYYNENGLEITAHFLQEKDFVVNNQSFFNLDPSKEIIQAETSSTVLIIERDKWNLFSENIPSWQFIFNLISNDFLLEKSKLQRNVIIQDTITVYLNFADKYPELIRIVPLGHIASYLGMTQSTLSRVRKKIVS